MRLINEKLKEAIQEAGKQEFLAQGFQKASMRNIAKAAGATTGAVYKYFPDKEALFNSIISDVANILETKYKATQEEFRDLNINDQVERLDKIITEDWMIDYIYDHYDVFKLIYCCSAGTKYENYIDCLVDIEVSASLDLIKRLQTEGYKIFNIDEELIHIVANTLFAGIFETIVHDMPRHKAKEYVKSLYIFYEAGWFRLLGI
ncbi:TetR/AcrR family transcriptional regulator [Cellulosilyticum ruminicola]|uniref:TetR/AcrR family transcriptional regulator n=1 Tax=Cellulosilyticum ruminicola TaxID=425254 RepID=UPI0006D1F88E|nr:TetR/AcrR family transcriptional regulator [Cellulosilyticum ruminicola]